MRLEDERDIEQLRTKALALARENERLSAKLVDILQENLALKGMTPDQLQQALALIDEELNKVKADASERPPSTERRPGPTAESGQAERKPRKGHGPRAQPNLTIVTEEHDLDEADKKCPACGGSLSLWEGQEDETEEVDVIERQFVLKKHIWKKYRCRCGGCVETALVPAKLVPGGRYSSEFAIEVAAAKYAEQMPLERQVHAMAGQGLIVDAQTLWDQVEALANRLRPAWKRLKECALTNCDHVLGFDESGWKVMTKGSRKSWTMWQLSTREVIYFDIAPARDTPEGERFLEGFTGIALGDAATVHKAMVKGAKYRLAFCWAHARRRFIQAEANDPVRARQFIEMVQELYAIEEQAPPGREGDELRRQLRNKKSRAVVERIMEWMRGQRFFPQSDIGMAIKYVAGNWDGLTVFLDEPAVPIDNNRTERGFRGPAIGRHNFYGSHSRRGTEVAAILYSLVETAKLNGVHPKHYLRRAVAAALEGEVIPLPYELRTEQLAR